MAWPERVAALVFAGFLLLNYMTFQPDSGAAAIGMVELSAILTAVAWVFLRLVDFAMGGPARRRR